MKESILSALLLLVSAALFADSELTEEQHNRIHNANHRPSVKLVKKRTMRHLSAIDEREARKRAEKFCGEPVRTVRLTHQDRKLYYDITTGHCHLHIDAMDGNVTLKERR